MEKEGKRSVHENYNFILLNSYNDSAGKNVYNTE